MTVKYGNLERVEGLRYKFREAWDRLVGCEGGKGINVSINGKYLDRDEVGLIAPVVEAAMYLKARSIADELTELGVDMGAVFDSLAKYAPTNTARNALRESAKTGETK